MGKSIAQDFVDMGFESVEQLIGKDPQTLYESLCNLKGYYVDRCMLYVFKCSVYFGEENDPDPELLKWWNWKG